MSICKPNVHQYRVTLSNLSCIDGMSMTNNGSRKDATFYLGDENCPLNKSDDIETTIQMKPSSRGSPSTTGTGTIPLSNDYSGRPPLYSELNRSTVGRGIINCTSGASFGVSSVNNGGGGPGSTAGTCITNGGGEGGGGGGRGGSGGNGGGAHNRKYRPRTVHSSRYKNHSDAFDGLVFVLSAIYSKIIVIIGLCFPMAEVISHRIPIGWYEGFYLYLYLGSILFLILIYLFRETGKRKKSSLMIRAKTFFLWSNVESGIDGGTDGSGRSHGGRRGETKLQSSSTNSSLSEDEISGPVHFGSFYLRLGAVAFGIGSMIYSGLEFGQYFELESKEQCYSFLYGFTPTAHMTFTFFQLYFIFMNSKNFISKHNYIGKFNRLLHNN